MIVPLLVPEMLFGTRFGFVVYTFLISSREEGARAPM